MSSIAIFARRVRKVDDVFGSFFRERMEEEQRATEELYEKRLEILSKSIKKAKKRPRIECFEEDGDDDLFQEEMNEV